jgi:hypothetical protein
MYLKEFCAHIFRLLTLEVDKVSSSTRKDSSDGGGPFYWAVERGHRLASPKGNGRKRERPREGEGKAVRYGIYLYVYANGLLTRSVYCYAGDRAATQSSTIGGRVYRLDSLYVSAPCDASLSWIGLFPS